ncbi:MAG: MmcQ/YjbR family DNA-binding protein [Candidatus Dormibacteraceae bacterium]
MKFERFRLLCLCLPEAEERETWGEPTFRVRGRIFAMGSLDGEFVSLKASLDDQSGLVEMDPKTFAPSAYTGRYGWVRVRLAGVGVGLAERLLTNAWKRAAPRRLVADYERRIGKP